jgi:hypothetical protein
MSTPPTSAKAIFLQALELTTATERQAYLDTRCGNDADLRCEVEELLRHHSDVRSFLESPPTAVAESADKLRTLAPQAPSLGFLMPSTRADSLGRLGHYEILEIVGSGGMGVVLKALDEQLHRIVAIKAMGQSLAASATARQRFFREAQAAAAVNHDNVVDIYAVEESGPIPYLAMEYVAGISLEDKLRQQGPLELKEILRIGLQTADGLAAAHRQGLVHRDVKPANILLENGVGRVKITDFGLARAVDDVSVTQTGVIAGTPQYMAPEQAKGEPLDHRCDLFSLGSVLYALCTGQAPFRGSTSLGVLKRVCEETPRPIRELNPDIPEWLCAVIDKLHAKAPAERFQSAAELAEVLGCYLAHLQQPSTPLPMGMVPAAAAQKPRPAMTAREWLRDRRQWAVAAVAALVVLGVTLSLTDASGLTNVAATMIRILVPEGTLVVESDDPAVRVTIEGDGGLVITGAGPQEVRLKPGSYKLQADKNGQRVPLERELVSIAKGGREVVRVKLETASAPAIAKSEQGAFVVLAAGKERKFDTLAEAVQGATDGDTIEVRGNGPFVSEPINIQRTALTIRAGAGFRPVIKLDPKALQRDVPLLATNAALVLEGLELHPAPPDDPTIRGAKAAVHTYQAPLRAANCRFRTAIWADHSPVCVFRNCEFLAENGHVAGRYTPGARVVCENCLHRTNGAAIGLYDDDAALDDVSIQIKQSTFVNRQTPLWLHLCSPLPAASDEPQGAQSIRLHVSGSIFEAPSALSFQQTAEFLKRATMLPPAAAEAALLSVLQWRGERNVFAAGRTYVMWWADAKQQPSRGPKSLEEWKQFWGTSEAGSLEGRIRFQGGNLLALADNALDQLTPDDFRLRPDSAGYRAGPDGKDLGADVDLVGPGAAYERWKKTPEYQQWLKESGQFRGRATARAETGAFVVLGGKGVAERKFDTLAEAVEFARDGDTIEIRGDGPFVSDGVSIQHSLVIRAGNGYTPSITLSPPAADSNTPLLNVRAPLVLEGLELRRMGGARGIAQGRVPKLIHAWESYGLHIANCRLVFNSDPLLRRSGNLIGTRGAVFTVLNCELNGNVEHAYQWHAPAGGRCTTDNCVSAFGLFGFQHHDPNLEDVSIRVRGNTIVGSCLSFVLWSKPNLQADAEATPLIRLDFSRNVTRPWGESPKRGVLYFQQSQLKEPYSAEEAESLLPRLVRLDGKQNVYQTRMPLLVVAADWQPLGGNRGRNLADWDRFWGQKSTGSVEGDVRFQGGDLIARAQSTPERLTAEDFRLSPDSAGYRALPGGKDLGADVDLVGPGAAYERWKKTPEYQEWLKDTGQLKGDTIEIRGNGPFVSEPINIQRTALTIRAGEGFRPVIKLKAQSWEPGGAIWTATLRTNAPLVLEGLELHRLDPPAKTEVFTHFVFSSGAPLHVANCRFLTPHQNCIWLVGSPFCVVRNCELLNSDAFALAGSQSSGGQWTIDNCLQATKVSLFYSSEDPTPEGGSIQLTRNSSVAQYGVWHALSKASALPEADQAVQPIRLEVVESVLDANAVLLFNQDHRYLSQAAPLGNAEAEAALVRLLNWQGRNNLYGNDLLAWSVGASRIAPHGPKSLADWKQFWKSNETGSVQSQVRYQGGDLRSRMATAPEKLTPDDFRLRPDSTGYRALPDGKDLGADVDLVGPGPAYERWKETPEYQQWLKDTGQVLKAEAPKAFVLLGGKGVELRKFDTLAEAVQGASAGDTIEIRGNGPFVSEPVSIQRTALTIRAAAGFRPVIKLSPEAVPHKGPLLKTNAALVLEGLEFHRAPPQDWESGGWTAVSAIEALVRAANCRFRAPVWANHSPVCEFRNCEFFTAEGGGVAGQFRSGSKFIFDNCLQRISAFPIGIQFDRAAHHDTSIQIKHSTFASNATSLWLLLRDPLPGPSDQSQASDPIRIDVSESIFDTSGVLGFEQTPEFLDKAAMLEPAEAEATILRLLTWQGERNLYSAGSASVGWSSAWNPQPPHGPKSLEEWKQFWKSSEPKSLEGRIRFQGGNLLARTDAALDQLTPNDFRLRSDSPGYRARPDGKDLGADVDLVGPGAAYERWKKTPEYQEWLTETEQMR